MRYNRKVRSIGVLLVVSLAFGAGCKGIPKRITAPSEAYLTGSSDQSCPPLESHDSRTANRLSLLDEQGDSPLLGFGWNFGVGFGYGWTTTANLPLDNGPHFGLEFPSFEFRLIPAADFSLDFQWRFSAVLSTAQPLVDWPFMFVFMPHFKKDEFSVAPGVMLGHSPVYGVGVVGFLGRIGGEIMDPESPFGFGVHFRPALVLTGHTPSRPSVGMELMCEFSWVFYIPRPTGR